MRPKCWTQPKGAYQTLERTPLCAENVIKHEQFYVFALDNSKIKWYIKRYFDKNEKKMKQFFNNINSVIIIIAVIIIGSGTVGYC